MKKLQVLCLICAVAFFVINVFMANKILDVFDAIFGVAYGWVALLSYFGLIGCIIGWCIEDLIEGEE